MSGGLMSCVRENSPPLEMDMNASGPLSLPEPRILTSDLLDSVHSSSHQNIMSSTPLAAHSTAHLDAGGSASCGASANITPHATPPNTEQTKRRRFHPLRNLRRIFRRRTITTTSAANPTVTDTPTSTLTVAPPTSSTSEKNLRSATLSSITSVASASSPSSPLTHQQLHDAYLTQSLPKSKSSYISLLGVGGRNKSHDHSVNTESKSKSKHKNKNQKQQQQSKDLELPEDEKMFGTTTQTSTSYHHHHATASSSSTSSVIGAKSTLPSQRQSIGVAVFPGAMNRNFFTERQKLRSVGDSSQDLDSGSGNDSGTGGGHVSSSAAQNNSGGEMSDSQRSLSEGRLIDSDFSRDGLSQSHDSVFSESATASSLSIVLKAELADVLRKRRNRPDASDEDLGLPRSPASPQRRVLAKSNGGSLSLATKQSMEKQSEVSSLSLLSMNSNDGDDILASSTANNSMATEIVQERGRYSRSSTMSSISMTSDILRHRDSSLDGSDRRDEVDLFSTDWQRLSHSAAKHKMAIRPAKKKGPSRQHRRTLETSIPEANEDLNKLGNKKLLDVKDFDAKAKTRSLPPGVNAAKLLEEQNNSSSTMTSTSISKKTASKESQLTTKTTSTIKTIKSQAPLAAATPVAATNLQTTTATAKSATSSNSTTTSTNSNSIFGFRSLTAKATSMFESKESTEEVLKKPEVIVSQPSVTMETEESGFLRRLMPRNSKRSIAKANAGDTETDGLGGDIKANEPKKLQTSSTASMESKTYSSSAFIQDVTKTEFSYMNSAAAAEKYNESRKKEEFVIDNKSSFSPLMSNFMLNTSVGKEDKKYDAENVAKPKSGAAARQRYLPQNISNENLQKANEDQLSASKESILSKSSANEIFQSTSIIREITKQQHASPAKAEHHFEKKPKIVGLSAFQQKISRSNDSFARTSSSNTSLTSLEQPEAELHPPVRAQIYEQKSRKSVEKSKSFRAYGEEKLSPVTTVHNNMPSLPDLSLNLRVPYYQEFVLNEKEYSSPSPPEPADEKHTSLGFEINDNKLIKPDREHRKSFSNYDKNIVMTTTPGQQMAPKASPQKYMPAPLTLVPPLSPSAACNRNISEIENNIDMIVKSPFISVIRKSTNYSEEQSFERMDTTKTNSERIRPTVLALKKEKSLSEDSVLNSPSTANVTLREKSYNKQNMLYASSSGSLEPFKDNERKSAPAPSTKTNGFKASSTRRSAGAIENVEVSQHGVPEFMKIQLNRVDPMRLSKSHVVLERNVKETTPMATITKSRETSPEKDEDFRRLSSESVDINERSSPEMEKRFTAVYHEAINKQTKLCIGLPPKSPLKKSMTMLPSTPTTPMLPATPTTPPTPTINERDARHEPEMHFKLPETKMATPTDSNSNSLSLQERRRLFMSEDKTKVEKKVEEIKYERKKSINEEISRKTVMKVETPESPTDSCVVLRKKSFASSNGSVVMNTTQSLNNGNKTDPTPELMKVFARRSLKVKDEDLDKMMNNSNNNNNITTASAPQTLKKFTTSSSTPSVDSDKENQSASEEKLDKLSKMETEQSITITKVSTAQTHSNHSANSNGTVMSNQRNSLADFRHMPAKVGPVGLSISNGNNNNSNNNNLSNNNSPINGNTPNNNKNFLPPIKITGFRHVSMERINNNNNNNNNTSLISPTKSTTLERPSIKLAELSSTAKTEMSTTMATTNMMSKTIERSATVGEFKGIHQRRAEWEQRAKEALK